MARKPRDPSEPGLFAYEAVAPNGTRIKGPKARMSAYSADDVRRELLDQGFTPIKITEVTSGSLGGVNLNMKVGRQGLRLKPIQLSAFARGLHQLLKAGISVPRAVAALGEDSENEELKTVCSDIATKIANGIPIAEAFATHPVTFDDVFCGYLASGEQTGALVAATGRLALMTEKRAQISSKVRSVAIYPLLVTTAISLLVTVLIVFIVPLFAKIYTQLHSTLPAPTQLLIKVSHYFLPIKLIHVSGIPLPFVNFLSPVLWLLVIIFSFRAFVKHRGNVPNIAIRLDKIRFRLPVFGKLGRYLALYRWMSTLAGALDSGVRTTAAITLAANSSGSRWIRTVSPSIETAIQSGQPLSAALAVHSDLFPASVRTMVSTGEQTGDLSVLLDSAAASLADEIDAIVGGLSAKIEVALLLTMAVVVGGILICLYLPVLNLAPTLAKTANLSNSSTTTTTVFP